jgi:hypothetical protein
MEPTQLDKERDGGTWRWWLLAVLIALVVFITAPPGASAITTAKDEPGTVTVLLPTTPEAVARSV